MFYGIWCDMIRFLFIISFLVVRSLTCESNNLPYYSDSVQSQYLQPINTLNLQTNVDNLFSGKLPRSKPKSPAVTLRKINSAVQAFLSQGPEFLLLSHSAVVMCPNMYCAYLVPSKYGSFHIHILYSLCVAVKMRAPQNANVTVTYIPLQS